MALGAKAGYKKLLVLSGLTKLDELTNWAYSEDWKPEYFIESLAALKTVIENVY